MRAYRLIGCWLLLASWLIACSSSPLGQAGPPALPSPTPPTAPLVSAVNPLLDGSPREWLPASDGYSMLQDVFSHIQSTSGATSNEALADTFADPAEILANLETWGRVTGSYVAYWESGEYGAAPCVFTPQFESVTLRAELYTTVSGAQRALAGLAALGAEEAVHQQASDRLGEQAYLTWSESHVECREEPGLVTRLDLLFRRSNALGWVTIVVTNRATSDSEVEALAIRLTQLMDQKMIAAAK